ncbi:hypothetical protein GCM10010103_04890 [Streptomyces paradoxus]
MTWLPIPVRRGWGMAERRFTRQDLVRRRRRGGFVGRRDEISAFRTNLGPRLLAGGVRLMRPVDETVVGKSQDRHAWVMRLVRSVLRLIARHSPGGNTAVPTAGP